MLKSTIIEKIESRIFHIRGKKVMIDKDLAELYGVDTKVLNQSIKRNAERFPKDFIFRLSRVEKDELVTNCDRFNSLKHSIATPSAFTEQGVAMLSSVLNSKHAIFVNIHIMRVFVAMRRTALTYTSLKRKINSMEKKYDSQFKAIFEAIRRLIMPEPQKPKRTIGFHKN